MLATIVARCRNLLNLGLEYAAEMFGKLGLRHLMVLEEGSSRLVGVVIKKRLVAYLDDLKEE